MTDRVHSQERDDGSGSPDIIDLDYMQHVAEQTAAREQEMKLMPPALMPYVLPAAPMPFEPVLDTSNSAHRVRLSNRQLMDSLPLDGNALRAQLRERGVCTGYTKLTSLHAGAKRTYG